MPYPVDPTRNRNWKTRTLLLLWFMQSWGQGYIIGGVELRLVTQKCVPYFFDQSPLSNSSCTIGNSEWNECHPQIVAVASTSDDNQQEVFVFYNSFFMVDSRIERLLYIHLYYYQRQLLHCAQSQRSWVFAQWREWLCNTRPIVDVCELSKWLN